MCRTMEFAEIRAFLVKRKFLRESIGEELFDRICNRDTADLPFSVMRELSIWIDGYMTARR